MAETAGVINIGIEGLMLVGCLAAYAGAGAGGSGWVGVAYAGAAGMALAALFAGVTVWLRADQIVSGTALNLLAIGLTTTAWAFLEQRMPELPHSAAGFSRAPLAGLSGLPVVGPIFFDQYALGYWLAGLTAALAVVLRRMRLGLILRARRRRRMRAMPWVFPCCWWRTGAVIFAGLCAGVAGAYLSIMRNHQFAPEMTGGQGFLVLALVIFGRWRVGGLIIGCLLFGAVDSLQQFLQASDNLRQFLAAHVGVDAIPYPYFKMLPYLAALAALALMSRGGRGPAFLGRPWPEDGR